MGRRGLTLVAALLAASRVWAAPPGVTGMGNPQGWRLQVDGVTAPGGSEVSTLNLDGQDFTPTCTAGTCALSLGAAVNLNVGAPGVGNSGDFESTVNLASKTLILPNSTATANSSCVPGEVYIENDNASTTATGASICRTTNTQVPVGDIVSGGISGGQVIAGGTGATDTLKLKPSTSGSARGAVKVCSDTPAPGANSTDCMAWWPDGASIGGSTTNFSAGAAAGTLTQTSDGGILGFPHVQLLRDQTVRLLSDSALNATYMGAHTTVYSAPTIRNATDDDVNISASGLNGYTGLYSAPTFSETGTGDLTVAQVSGLWFAPTSVAAVTLPLVYGARLTMPAITVANNVCTANLTPYACCTGNGTGSGADQCAAGTITDAYGVWAGAPSGTNQHPYSAAQAALAGSTKSNEGDWGVENTGTTQFWFRGDTQAVWRTPILKQTDEARASNTSLTNDGALSFAVAASGKYRFRLVVFFDTAATPDFKYALSCPASPTLVRIVRNHIVPGTTTLVTGVDTACTASTSVTGTGTTGGYVEMEGTIQNGANAGTVAFQWAQDTSNGSNTTVLAGSMLEWATL